MAGLGGSAFAADNRILYHVHNSMPYVTLDPSIEYSNGIMVLQNVYETLTHYDPATEAVAPMLATSWTSNEDGTVWVFQIRDDVTFHDGSKLTALQVVNSIKRSMDLGQGGAYSRWSTPSSAPWISDRAAHTSGMRFWKRTAVR